jgi:hypothetical protein
MVFIVTRFTIIKTGEIKSLIHRGKHKTSSRKLHKTTATLHLKKQKSDTRRTGALFILKNAFINLHDKPMQ